MEQQYGRFSRDDVMRKLQRLLDQQRGQEALGNQAEAEEFAAKVQHLLARWNLSMDDVEYAARDKVDPYGEQLFNTVEDQALAHLFKAKRVPWMEMLAEVVAKAHNCRILVWQTHNCISFVGRGLDRQLAVYVYTRLVNFADAESHGQARRHRRQAREQAGTDRRSLGGKQQTPAWAKGFRESWLLGFITGIQRRYNEEAARIIEQARLEGKDKALVRMSNERALVKQWIDNRNVPKAKPLGEGPENKNMAGFRLGVEAAMRAELRANGLATGKPEKEVLALGAGHFCPSMLAAEGALVHALECPVCGWKAPLH